MKLMFAIFLTISLPIFAQQSKSIEWLIKPNWILNPGAESNDNSLPKNWKTDFPGGGESNWVSPYGVTSHEWNSGNRMLGLPPNAGNNYFRLNVNNESHLRRINLYQEFSIADLTSILLEDTVMATFSCQIASNEFTAENCSYSKVKVTYTDDQKSILDSIIFHRAPSQFRDLDANSAESTERGFSVMHEFQPINSSHQVPLKAKNVRVELYVEFPCFVKTEEDESPLNYSNTFFFDNVSLGFYKK